MQWIQNFITVHGDIDVIDLDFNFGKACLTTPSTTTPGKVQYYAFIFDLKIFTL